jgi:glycerophosphoryl diester phosphodiesterase
MLTIGHKGADALVPGNTLESFAAAVETGLEAIEFDVLRPQEDFADGTDWRKARAGPANASGPLVVAHDWGDARRRKPLTLAEALDAFTRPPLDRVRFDLDLKVAGREDEIVAALAERDLTERAMASTMEVASLVYLRDAAPELDRGWTLPKASRDWSRSRLLRPVFLAGSASLRARLPAIIRRRAPELGVWAVWVYHPLITRRLLDAAHDVGISVVAWTVDDFERIKRLTALGVDGICSNDPRLFGERPATAPAPSEPV